MSFEFGPIRLLHWSHRLNHQSSISARLTRPGAHLRLTPTTRWMRLARARRSRIQYQQYRSETFVKHFVAREQEADRQPTQVRLEKAWHNAGRRGHRNELRITFNQQMAAAGKEVNVGRPKNSPRNSPK